MKHSIINQFPKINTIISLEGNIGSGKENILNFLKRCFNENLVILDDSIYTWENKGLLKNYYENPERWAFTLEVFSTLQKSKRLNDIIAQKSDSGNFIITRRSVVSDRDCFVKACKTMNYINDQEQNIYDFVFSTIKIPKYTCVIYLKSNVNKCYETIISKRSTNEKEISFDYLRCIHDNYENWISNLRKDNVNVIEIDAEKFRNIDNNEYLQDLFIQNLKQHFPLLVNNINEYKPAKLRKSVSLKNCEIKSIDSLAPDNSFVYSKINSTNEQLCLNNKQNFISTKDSGITKAPPETNAETKSFNELDKQSSVVDERFVETEGRQSATFGGCWSAPTTQLVFSNLSGSKIQCSNLKLGTDQRTSPSDLVDSLFPCSTKQSDNENTSFVDSIRKSHSVNAL